MFSFIRDFKLRPMIEKAYVYYWLYGVMVSLILIFSIKAYLLIHIISNGFIFANIPAVIFLVWFLGLFRTCSVSSFEEIEKDTFAIAKLWVIIVIVQSILIALANFVSPDLFLRFVSTKNGYGVNSFWFPVFIIYPSFKFGGMGAIWRFIQKQKELDEENLGSNIA